MGLYGMGGIGKTSICKVLCNKFFSKFCGRVCHAELGSKSEEELIQEVVKKLTGTSQERLKEFNVDQLCNVLKEGIIRVSVFLAIDNMSDSDASIKQAKTYLSATLPSGSIVMVTSRSKDFLKKLRPYIDESKCLEMPELEVEHAEMLFAKSSDFEPRNEDDKELLKRCVQQCYFQKGAGNENSHYHPLALDVLGRHLGCMDPKELGAELEKIDRIGEHRRRKTSDYLIGEDYSSIVYNSIFSILRTSFDTLSQYDQLLFMDVALFSIESADPILQRKWIGMVHRNFQRTKDVMRALGRLKSKSLLESLGDGIKTSVGMHDLWRAFCVAETKFGELGCRHWVYEAEKVSELVETSPSGTCWEKVKRMAFRDCKLESLERVNFAYFPNVGVLKITGINMTKKLVLDLSGLIHLKSLEVLGRHLQRLVLLGLPRSLICLIWTPDLDEAMSALLDLNESDSSRHLITQIGGLREHWDHWRSNTRQLIEQIVCFKDLQYLSLVGYEGGKLPDVGSMVSMLAADFHGCKNVVTLTRLSSKMTDLRRLNLSGCRKLRSCPGVGDLVHLQKLKLEGCRELKRLPNLRKLRNLFLLNISKCPLITEVPGLGDLVALEYFYAGKEFKFWDGIKSSYSLKLPDVRKLSNLKVLSLRDCRMKAFPGFDSLTSLHHVEADFREVEERPGLAQLTKLQTLKICGCSSKELGELDNLVMLQTLKIVHCSGVEKLPDIRSSIRIAWLLIEECEFKDVSSLGNLSALETLSIRKCNKLERLPDLQRLTRLKQLWISWCDMVRGWDCTLGQVEVKNLRKLVLSNCNSFDDLTCIQAFSQLEKLRCSRLLVMELPDLSSFSQLKTLELKSCERSRRLSCREPMNALSKFEIRFCGSLVTIPDLCNFPGLLKLVMSRRNGRLLLSSSGPLTALQRLDLSYCSDLEVLPDLGMLPALEKLFLKSCGEVKSLNSSVPLPALKELDARECRSLSHDDLDQLQALCPQCEIKYPALENTWRSRLLRSSKR